MSLTSCLEVALRCLFAGLVGYCTCFVNTLLGRGWFSPVLLTGPRKRPLILFTGDRQQLYYVYPMLCLCHVYLSATVTWTNYQATVSPQMQLNDGHGHGPET